MKLKGTETKAKSLKQNISEKNEQRNQNTEDV